MRKDMNKVLTERTRAGGNSGKSRRFEKQSKPREERYFKGVKVDLSVKKESMRRRHIVNGDYKSFTDHLSPLQRYLVSQVGRKWDDVWSDICKVLKGSGLQANHVKQHVKWEVDGIPHSGETFFGARFRGENKWHQPGFGVVYVDKNWIVRKTPDEKKRPAKVYDHVRESDTVEYHKINGCWFRMEISSYKVEYPGYFGPYTRDRYYVVNKRALSKKEAKKRDLNNRLSTRRSRISEENFKTVSW